MTTKWGFELYLDAIQRKLEDVIRPQGHEILQAAELIADSLAQGGVLHVFGTSHSQLLAQEIFYRAGCLAPTNALIEPTMGMRKATENAYWSERQEGYGKIILDSYDTRPGEVILIISTSGRNEVPVEMAIEAKKRGLKVIALLSLPYCAQVAPRHSSGKKLPELADVVLDNGAVLGDAEIEIEGVSHRLGPTSGAVGAALLQGLVVQVAETLARQGVEPPVWVSVNVPNGLEINARHIEKYGGRVKHL